MNQGMNLLLKGATIGVFFSIVSALIGFFSKIILTNYFSVAEVGFYYSLLAITTTVFVFKDYGLGKTIQRFLPIYIQKDQEEKARFLILYAIGFIVLSLLIFVILIIIFSDSILGAFLDEPIPKIIFFILVTEYVLGMIGDIIRNILISQHKIFLAKMIPVLKELLLLVFLFIFINQGLFGIVNARLIGAVLSTLLLVYFFPFRYVKKKTMFNLQKAKKYISYGLPFTLSEFLMKQGKYFDVLILTLFLGAEEVGIYSIAYYLPIATTAITASFSSILTPHISKGTASKNKNENRNTTTYLYRMINIISIMTTIVLVVYAKTIIRLVYGNEYVVGAVVLQITAIAMLFRNMNSINTSVLNGFGKSKELGKLLSLSAIINIGFNLALIPFFGINGAALATFFQVTVLFFLMIKSLKKFHIILPWKILGKTLIIGIFCGVIMFVPKHFYPTLTMNIITLVFGSLLYLILIFIFKIITRIEAESIINSIFESVGLKNILGRLK